MTVGNIVVGLGAASLLIIGIALGNVWNITAMSLVLAAAVTNLITIRARRRRQQKGLDAES